MTVAEADRVRLSPKEVLNIIHNLNERYNGAFVNTHNAMNLELDEWSQSVGRHAPP